jgi:asparagine synthase (glutamine-hydrolysing)
LVDVRANEAAIPEQLATRSIAGEETLFAGVRKLLPGHRLVFEDGRAAVGQYWDVPHEAVAPSERTEAEWTAQFRQLLEESVRLRLMADVPLGMFLSGGLDSSAIAAILARQIDRPLKTFSVAFSERAYSELAWSREVAAAIRAEPHEVVLGPEQFFDALPRLLWHEDEPIAHPSSIPLYFVSKLAREHVIVVLTGEGSDELLAGYGRYPRALLNWRFARTWAAMAPEVLRRSVSERLLPLLPGRAGRYARRSFLGVAPTPEATFFDNFASVALKDQRRLLGRTLRPRATPEAAYAASLEWLDRASGRPWLERVLYADLKTYLVELLMKQDQMSMAASIESRVPFLDHRLVEFVTSMPSSLKLSGWTTKRVLRETARDLLPTSVLQRPKMGFPVPFGIWTRGAWHGPLRDVLLDRRTRERGLFEPAAVARLLEEHREGRGDHGDVLWSLLNLELWYRTWIDGAGIQQLGTSGATASRAAAADSRQAEAGLVSTT